MALNKEIKDESGKSLLYFASRYNQIEAVKYLATHCGRQDIKDFINSKTYSEDITELKDEEQIMSEVERVIKSTTENVQIEIIYLIWSKLFAKADIDAEEREGYTPLHLESKKGHLNIVKCLIVANANIEAKTNSGETPLLLACYYGHLDIVKFLIEEKANIEAKDNYGFTPLILASANGHLDIP